MTGARLTRFTNDGEHPVVDKGVARRAGEVPERVTFKVAALGTSPREIALAERSRCPPNLGGQLVFHNFKLPTTEHP